MKGEQISIIILSFSEFLRKNCIKNKKSGSIHRGKRPKLVSFTEKQVFWTVSRLYETSKNCVSHRWPEFLSGHGISNWRLFVCRTTDHVIPRRSEGPTWESPGTMFVPAQQVDEWYQEIATVALLPRNDIAGQIVQKEKPGSVCFRVLWMIQLILTFMKRLSTWRETSVGR